MSTLPFSPEPGKAVAFNFARKCFVMNNHTPLRGVTGVIAQLFWPRYHASRARLGTLSARGDALSREAALLTGMDLGRLVDQEAGRLTRLAWAYGLGWEHLLPSATGEFPADLPSAMSSRERSEFRHLQLNCNLYTRRFLCALRARGLFPIASQVGVGSLKARLGTAVDIVCAREEDVLRVDGRSVLCGGFRVVLIELKCGYETNYERYCGPMHTPLSRFNDSPLSQHQVQLLVTRILFERTYSRARGVCVDTGFVVRVHGDGVTFFEARTWSAKEQWDVWNVIVASRGKGEKARKTKRRKVA